MYNLIDINYVICEVEQAMTEVVYSYTCSVYGVSAKKKPFKIRQLETKRKIAHAKQPREFPRCPEIFKAYQLISGQFHP